MKDKQILKLEEFLPYRLSVLSNKVSSTIAQTYKNKFALSVTEWRIMAVLGEYPNISAEDVSAKTQIEKSMLSRSVSKLLTRKLIDREFTENDRRRSSLKLSTVGESVYQEVIPVSYRYQRLLNECFDDDEAAQFDRLLTRLYDHVQNVKLAPDD